MSGMNMLRSGSEKLNTGWAVPTTSVISLIQAFVIALLVVC